MIIARRLNGKLAEELAECIENDSNGTYQIFLRYKLFIDKLENQIEISNNEIISNLSKEDDEVKHSMMSQPDIDNSLNYFKDLLFKSILVSLFSYLEMKLSEVAAICETHIPTLKKITSYNKDGISGKSLSVIETNFEFLNTEVALINSKTTIIPDLKSWKDIRNFIVHNKKSIANLPSTSFLESNFIEIEDLNLKFISKQSVLNFHKFSIDLIKEVMESIENKYNLVTRQSIG